MQWPRRGSGSLEILTATIPLSKNDPSPPKPGAFLGILLVSWLPRFFRTCCSVGSVYACRSVQVCFFQDCSASKKYPSWVSIRVVCVPGASP
ncbi:hypothetical protein CSUI_010567 [Cystoisospora suis]|uniref:Uncharacterized protein n=1 Tax=Cystoisospora suis TaxID=483139 RepID=A0A2C6KGF1_9APIC|nr:hypothetical protein CSUI_010567 [Cystoisospora suis]